MRPISSPATKTVDAMPTVVGARLGHFRIQAKLGEGGMGVVFRAWDENLERPVALKILPSELAGDGEHRQRFLREARLAAGLSHPNIATIHEIGDSEGQVFIAMELVTGQSLRDGLTHGRLPLAESLRIAILIAKALAKAHEQGIVHRDLKPDNVMLTDAGEVKVLDFGLARHSEEASKPSEDRPSSVTRLTEQGTILGTPGYMSPEQASGLPVDRRSDLFSFGVLLYEMCTGTLPFHGASAMEVMISAARDEPTAPSKLNAEVSVQLERLIVRCLSKKPDQRHASAGLLLRDLEIVMQPGQILQAEAAAPTPVTSGHTELASSSPRLGTSSGSARASKVVRRARPLWLAAVTAAVVIGVIGLAVARSSGLLRRIAGGSGVPITDHPLPHSSSPDALRLYAEALKALRNGQRDSARRLFERAVEKDPELGAAHLRLATADLGGVADPAQGRAEWTKARELRSALDARDQAILDAEEPMFLSSPADATELVRRFEALAHQLPGDVEVLGNLEFAMQLANFSRSSLIEITEQEDALDPEGARSASVIEWKAYAGDFAGARASAARCLTDSPLNTECLAYKINLEELDGNAAGVEGDARRWLVIEPHNSTASIELAEGLWGLGRPERAVAQVYRQAIAELPEGERPLGTARFERNQAILFGDFAEGVRQGETALKLAAADPKELAHAEAARVQSALLEEMGQPQEAMKVAADFLDRRDAWEARPRADDTSMLEDPTAELLAVERRGGGRTAESFAKDQAADVARWEKKELNASAPYLWVAQYAAAVETPEEAQEAMAALPRFLPIPRFTLPPEFDLDAVVGRTLFLAGRVDEALPILERAVKACFGLRFPLEHTRSSFFLAEARAAKGDKAGACAAYQEVLKRWGSAKPRSVTAEKARDQAHALGCPL